MKRVLFGREVLRHLPSTVFYELPLRSALRLRPHLIGPGPAWSIGLFTFRSFAPFTQPTALLGTESVTPRSTNMSLQYQYIHTWIRIHQREERGASLVEYALLVALIALVCIAAVTLLGQTLDTQFSETSSSLG